MQILAQVSGLAVSIIYQEPLQLDPLLQLLLPVVLVS
jgi:hypothetical protein